MELSYDCRSQDYIKLVSGDIVKVRDLKKQKTKFTFYLWDSNEFKILSRNFINTVQYGYIGKRALSISISTGFHAYGSHNSGKRIMSENGLATSVQGWFGPIIYPRSQVKAPLQLEFEVFLKPGKYLTVAYSSVNSGKVDGSNGGGKSATLTFNDDMLEFYYKKYSFNDRFDTQAGVFVCQNKISLTETKILPYSKEFKSDKISPGIHLGAGYSLFYGKYFNMALISQLRLAFPNKIGGDMIDKENLSLSSWLIGVRWKLNIYNEP
jgi:hypothetical protein